jgi:hypothetical protein
MRNAYNKNYISSTKSRIKQASCYDILIFELGFRKDLRQLKGQEQPVGVGTQFTSRPALAHKRRYGEILYKIL